MDPLLKYLTQRRHLSYKSLSQTQTSIVERDADSKQRNPETIFSHGWNLGDFVSFCFVICSCASQLTQWLSFSLSLSVLHFLYRAWSSSTSKLQMDLWVIIQQYNRKCNWYISQYVPAASLRCQNVACPRTTSSSFQEVYIYIYSKCLFMSRYRI